MNGWLRLWIFISAIWCAAVITVASIIYIDTQNTPSTYRVNTKMSEELKQFYKDLEVDEEGPRYTLTVKYTDGSDQSIRFPLIDEPIIKDEFEKKINGFAGKENKSVSKRELNKFYNLVSKKNKRAAEAKAEYDEEYELLTLKIQQEKANIIYIAIASAVVPSVLILLLGYGVAWVRTGFKSNA